MKINRLILAALLSMASIAVSAQDNRFGLWYEAGASYKFYKDFSAELNGSIRTDQNGSNIESFLFEGGVKYKVSKYLSTGLYYKQTRQKEDNGLFYPRHRFFAEVKGDLPLNRFTISARYRFQRQTKTYIDKPEDEIPEYYNRIKLKLDYDIAGLPLEPYIAAELFSQTFSSNDIMIEKERYYAGMTWNINKKHSVGVEYIYIESKVSKPHYFNVVGLNYSVSL